MIADAPKPRPVPSAMSGRAAEVVMPLPLCTNRDEAPKSAELKASVARPCERAGTANVGAGRGGGSRGDSLPRWLFRLLTHVRSMTTVRTADRPA